MQKEIKFFVDMSKFDLYKGFENISDYILMQDRIDEMSVGNDYFYLMVCTLLYHQIVDNMLHSLLIQAYYVDRLEAYPELVKKDKIPERFATKNKRLATVKFSFASKDEFIKKAKQINDFRNAFAHKAIKIEKNVPCSISEVRKLYHEIEEIYLNVSINVYNKIAEETTDRIKSYLSNSQQNDLKYLGEYILREWKNIDVDMMGSIIYELYIELYNKENEQNKIDYSALWNEFTFGKMSKKRLAECLKIK